MTRPRALACGLWLALSFAPCLAATPTAGEQRLRAAIEADQPHAIALLERLVNQNSGSLNLAGVKAVGDMVRAELEPLGFEVEWIDMRATGRAGHLVATHRGNGRGKRVLMIGTSTPCSNPTPRSSASSATATMRPGRASPTTRAGW